MSSPTRGSLICVAHDAARKAKTARIDFAGARLRKESCMKSRLSLLLVMVAFSATAALATDFGVHAGYYGNDLKEAFVGADLVLPFGPVALVPNIDYSRSHGIGYWFGSADLDLRYATSGG